MGLIIPSARNRVIRGIRDSIPTGYVIGRASNGAGAAEIIPLGDLAHSMVAANFVAAPSNLSEELDALFGSAEGTMAQRGPAVWQGLSPGTANQLLASGGASALNSWKGLSALLDAVMGSTRGMIIYRGASGWASLAAGVTGTFLQSQFTTGDPQWFSLITGVPVGGNLAKFGTFNTITNGDLSGDVTTSGTLLTTLATVNSNVGTFGDSSHVPQFTVDAKGRITGVSNIAISGGGSIALTDSHIFVGNSSNIATDVAMSGDVAIADTGATTIQSNAVTTSKINNAAVTLAKIQNAAASSKLLGSGASGSGSAYTELSISANFTFSGTTIDLSNSGASAGSYGSGTLVPVFTVDAKGRITSISTTPVTGSGGGATGLWANVLSATPTKSGTGLSNTLGSGAAVADTAAGVNVTGSSGMGVYTTSVPSTPYSITALLAINTNTGQGSPPTTAATVLGMGWTDGTKIHFAYLDGSGHINVQGNSNITTFSSTILQSTGQGFTRILAWFKIRDDGTNVTFSLSTDGVNFWQFYTVAKASGFLGSTGYSHIFVGSPGGTGAQDTTVMSWTQGV